MLTTRCPHCSTVFRIRPEQLSVRGGRVRCGHCQQAFSALSHLEEMDEEDIAPSPRPAPTPRPAVAAPTPPPAPTPAPVSAPIPKPVPVAAPVRPPEPVPVPVPVPAAAPAPVAPPRTAPPPAPAPVHPPKEPTIIVAQPRPAVPPPPPTPAVLPANIARAPVPMHSPWGALDSDPDHGFPSLNQASEPAVEQAPLFKTERLRPAPEAVPDSEAPAAFVSPPEKSALRAFTARSPEAEAPAVGDDFSMNIVLDSSKLPANTPADEDMDFDFSGLGDEPEASLSPPAPAPSAPYQSAIGKALGVAAYEPSQELDFGQTVMLEEPIDLVAMPNSDNAPDSLFFERERQQSMPRARVEDRRKSGLAWPWALGVLGLLLLAALQLSFVFRVELAQAVPQTRPHLEWACAWLGCNVPYPQDAEQIVIETSNFIPETGSEGKFRLVLTILNKAPHQQAWPHLELTVTDRFDIAVARRVLTPAEWLPAAYAGQPAFDGHSEVTANLPLAISNLQAAGYRLYVFYP